MDTKECDEQEMQANFSSNPESKKNWGKKKKRRPARPAIRNNSQVILGLLLFYKNL